VRRGVAAAGEVLHTRNPWVRPRLAVKRDKTSRRQGAEACRGKRGAAY
jgi:hypothetical protein